MNQKHKSALFCMCYIYRNNKAIVIMRLTSWRTLMAYFVVSRNAEEAFNQFLSPDHLRGGPAHKDNTSCVKTSSQSER